MSNENQDKFGEDLEGLMSFLKNFKGSDLPDEQLVNQLITQVLSVREETVARNLTTIDIGIVMIASGYLLDPNLKEHSTFSLLQGIFTKRGIDLIMADMRENGMEVSFDQVHMAMDKVFSFVMEFGLSSLHKGMIKAGVDCSPPNSNNLNFGDIGIEDPFKDSPEAWDFAASLL